ncbi:SOS response-associated peptidase [Aquimarina sp. 2201CG5-10]|uniref:SOS response-associated peptidase n=1 Tax=Aquimarina callyspongiae TaxID=3098150 RepID=UPI002AB34AA4|nr:SOS response-associated peptidase family protein [Aquimarina sp. 2201CG5-10]MDY8137577.1 SOS response-associated peptidase family protein [Aquimarina sp. 2201CG5-10]
MCYHAAQARNVRILERRYNVKRTDLFDIRDDDCTAHHFNGFAHPDMLFIPQESKEELIPGMWGIMPHNQLASKQNEYYKEIARVGGGLNAKCESAFDHFIYKHSIMERRCIIPLSGFFEPHKHNGTPYPFYFGAKDEDLLSVAGIYSLTRDGAVTFTMFTKEASPFFSKIHNSKNRDGQYRQIVLLDKELEKEWLRDDLNEKHIEELFNVQYDDELLTAHPVSRDIFSRSIDSNRSDIKEYVEHPDLKGVF